MKEVVYIIDYWQFPYIYSHQCYRKRIYFGFENICCTRRSFISELKCTIFHHNRYKSILFVCLFAAYVLSLILCVSVFQNVCWAPPFQCRCVVLCCALCASTLLCLCWFYRKLSMCNVFTTFVLRMRHFCKSLVGKDHFI